MNLTRKGEVLYLIAKGKTGHRVQAAYRKKKGPIWCLNNMVPSEVSDIEHLHWDIHKPLHHPESELLADYMKLHIPEKVRKVQVFTRDMYPLQEIYDAFHIKFFYTSIAYMLALAIHLGYKHIYMYGVDYFSGEHDTYMVPACIEFWIGVAKGRGIECYLSEYSQLFKSPDKWKIDNYNRGVRLGKEPDWIPSAKYLHNENYIYL